MKKFIIFIITAVAIILSSCGRSVDRFAGMPTEEKSIPSASEVYAHYTFYECQDIIDSLSVIDWGKWFSTHKLKEWDDAVGVSTPIYYAVDDLEKYDLHCERTNKLVGEYAYKATWLKHSMYEKRDSVMQRKYPNEWKKYQNYLASMNAYIEETKEAYRELYREQREHKYDKPKKYKTSVSYTQYGTIVTLTEK